MFIHNIFIQISIMGITQFHYFIAFQDDSSRFQAESMTMQKYCTNIICYYETSIYISEGQGHAITLQKWKRCMCCSCDTISISYNHVDSIDISFEIMRRILIGNKRFYVAKSIKISTSKMLNLNTVVRA